MHGARWPQDDKELAQQLAGQLEAAATTETMGEESEAFTAAFPDFVSGVRHLHELITALVLFPVLQLIMGHSHTRLVAVCHLLPLGS